MDSAGFKEIIEFAIKNEQEAYRLYENSRDLVKSASAKELLSEMARMERGHEQRLFQVLAAGANTLAVVASPEAKDLHISDYLVEIELKPDSPIEDVFIFAMKAEEKAYNLYSRISMSCREPSLRTIFEQLAAEEKKHKYDLEAEYDRGVLTEN